MDILAGSARTTEVATTKIEEAALDWVEPQGLNVVDLVGQVPESALAGMVISATPGFGILRYTSGSRIGNTVVITATAYPRFIVDGTWNGSMLGCLGQPAKIDQLGSTSPASTLRLLDGTRDVTREASLYRYVPATLAKPVRNPVQSEVQNLYRYDKSSLLNSSFTADGQLILPANMGCEIIISYRNYPQLTAVFTIQAPQMVQVTVLGSQDFTFYSYLGPGYAGHLTSLMNQLRGAGYPDRHDKLPLNVPAGADYFLLNLKPSSADPFTAFPGNPRANVDRPMTTTYRFTIGTGLTVDHVNSMGLPLYGHWRDADQSSGQYLLPYAKQAILFAAPEYFLPPGIPYNSCMTDGGCPRELLDHIYHTPVTMQAYYLRVERTSPALQRYATQMVGPGWWGGMAAAAGPGARWEPAPDKPAAAMRATGTLLSLDKPTFLPLILRVFPPLPPDDATGCSASGGCGWFTTDGRMVDYIPLP
ncbi:MAG: hypothetical protein ACUVS6_14100 [Anaerolineae bacterium]